MQPHLAFFAKALVCTDVLLYNSGMKGVRYDLYADLKPVA